MSGAGIAAAPRGGRRPPGSACCELCEHHDSCGRRDDAPETAAGVTRRQRWRQQRQRRRQRWRWLTAATEIFTLARGWRAIFFLQYSQYMYCHTEYEYSSTMVLQLYHTCVPVGTPRLSTSCAFAATTGVAERVGNPSQATVAWLGQSSNRACDIAILFLVLQFAIPILLFCTAGVV